MKNKKLLYVLVPLVALVWGLIIWKVLAFQPEPQSSAAIQLPQEQQQVDTGRYALRMNYQDPFLRSAGRTKSSTVSGSTKRANNIKKVKISNVQGPVKPDGLVYRGVISCNGDRVGLLEVDGKKKLIKEDTRVGEFRIVAVGLDSLRINYMEKEYVYGKQ